MAILSEQLGKGLKYYVESTVTKPKTDQYYNENFCWAVQEYHSHKGEFTRADIEYLEDNEWSISELEALIDDEVFITD